MEFNLEEYMSAGIERIVKDAMMATLSDPKESLFMARFALSSREASKRRAALEAEGEHIPPFLIASITGSCNLHCAGCYARENHICGDDGCEVQNQLTGEQWGKVFKEAKELGVSFILLAGGEPLLRHDVLQEAAKTPEILFPIFTNGTLVDEKYLSQFNKSRNLLPVFSIEGEQSKTDERRGAGMYRKLMTAMETLQQQHLMFGASVTVTTANLGEVLSDEFLSVLVERGCKVVFYIEYVPVTDDSAALALQDAERAELERGIASLREKYPEMLFFSFPGDEKQTGGCLAAGRGFFHINPHGGAEPCPFSPYSDINVAKTSLREALHSKLFTALRDGDILTEDHTGGCVLFEKKTQVEQILQK